MKAKEARLLIGKEVEWVEGECPWRGGLVRKGIIREVTGRNVRIDFFGTTDWKWLPDMKSIKEVPNSEVTRPGGFSPGPVSEANEG